jgi:hypothetical protein
MKRVGIIEWGLGVSAIKMISQNDVNPNREAWHYRFSLLRHDEESATKSITKMRGSIFRVPK